MTAPADVRLLILDVDGVLTDGSVLIDSRGEETKRFHVRDGTGISVWRRLGLEVAIVSGRNSPAVIHRARELDIRHVVQGAHRKADALDAIRFATGVPPESAACVADDWPDLPLMRRVGYPIAVADAHPDVLALARYTTTRPGGHAAVREAIEHLLQARGILEQARLLYDL